jgi:glycosyltransferase involved in cell wall biosynthesis
VRKVLLMIPSLDYSGTSKQFSLLAAGLPRPRFHVGALVLSDSAPQADVLRTWGVDVCQLGWRRLIDLGVYRRLRRLLASFRPDVIHVWQPLGLWVLAGVGGGMTGRLIASAPAQPRPSRMTWRPLDRWLLGRADRIVAIGTSAAEQCRRQRLPQERIIAIPPGIGTRTNAMARADLCRRLEIEEDARLIICAGPIVAHKGFHDAIWTLEILRFLFEDLHLIFVGDGPHRPRLEQFVHAIGAESHVHFLGYQPDASALLGLGEVVWIPSRTHGGVNVALEAMSAGRPVVASRLPALAEVIVDGETGFLIHPGDKVALARKTRCLLDDPKCRQQMGEAGRQRVERHFTAAQFVDRFARLYEEVAEIHQC